MLSIFIHFLSTLVRFIRLSTPPSNKQHVPQETCFSVGSCARAVSRAPVGPYCTKVRGRCSNIRWWLNGVVDCWRPLHWAPLCPAKRVPPDPNPWSSRLTAVWGDAPHSPRASSRPPVVWRKRLTRPRAPRFLGNDAGRTSWVEYKITQNKDLPIQQLCSLFWSIKALLFTGVSLEGCGENERRMRSTSQKD